MSETCCEITIAPEENVLEIAPEEIVLELAEVGAQGPQGIQGLPGGLTERELLAIATNGQTVFNLTAVPSLPHLSQLYLNGAKQALGTDYLINSSTLTWLSAIALEPADSLEIYY